MPFRIETKVESRWKFVDDVRAGGLSKAEACRRHGISRPTGDKWLRRYDELGIAGLCDLPTAPQCQALRTPRDLEDAVLTLRRQQPSFGPRKLHAWLRARYPDRPWPVPSTIGAILNRNGVEVREARRRRRTPPSVQRLSSPNAPNAVWGIDFKGQFRLGNGRLCYPLTVTDLATRMVLACSAFHAIRGHDVRDVLARLFVQHGPPVALRSDNGAPFASPGIAGLSALSCWWLSLGIGHERIEPGHPEQNGCHERFHLTLKEETTRPSAETLAGQQGRFDRFVVWFNEERPHEAIGQRTPSSMWKPSGRSAAQSEAMRYADCDLVYRVKRSGEFLFRKAPVFVGSALAGHAVGLQELEPDVWLVRFAGVDLGLFEDGDTRVSPLRNSGDRQGNSAVATPSQTTP